MVAGRQNFGDGQEIIFKDLNKVPSRTERLIFDKMLFELIGRQQQGFFQDSLKVSRISNTEVLVKAGMGFQLLATDAHEPDMKPVIADANINIIIPAADPTNDRIDLLVVKANFIDGQQESRKFKDAFTNDISSQNFIVDKVWSSAFLVVAGTPAGSPVAPAIPAGYINLAELLVEAANGIVAASNVTDKRNLLPLAGFSGTTGSSEYDAVIGDTSTLGVSHETLKAALDDPAIVSGAKILVTRDESIGAIPEVTQNNIEIVFKPNITFTRDGVTIALRINADGVKVYGIRCADFSTVGDIAIEIVAGKKYNIIESARFLNCDTEIGGLTGQNIANNSIVE